MATVQMVNVRIPLPLLAALDSITERQRRTRHATILVALEQYAKRNAAPVGGTNGAASTTKGNLRNATSHDSTAGQRRG